MLLCSGPSNLHPPSFKTCTLLSNRDLLTNGELSQRGGGCVEQAHSAGYGMCYDGHGEPARTRGHYQSAYSTFIPRVRKHVYLLFMSSVLFSCSPPVCPTCLGSNLSLARRLLVPIIPLIFLCLLQGAWVSTSLLFLPSS